MPRIYPSKYIVLASTILFTLPSLLPLIPCSLRYTMPSTMCSQLLVIPIGRLGSRYIAIDASMQLRCCGSGGSSLGVICQPVQAIRQACGQAINTLLQWGIGTGGSLGVVCRLVQAWVRGYSGVGRGIYAGQHGLYGRYMDTGGRQIYGYKYVAIVAQVGLVARGVICQLARAIQQIYGYGRAVDVQLEYVASSVDRGLVARGVVYQPVQAIQQTYGQATGIQLQWYRSRASSQGGYMPAGTGYIVVRYIDIGRRQTYSYIVYGCSSVGQELVARGVICRLVRAIQQLDMQIRVGGRRMATNVQLQ